MCKDNMSKRFCSDYAYGSVGGWAGAKVGAFAGDALQKTVGAFFGMGDYTLRTNSLITGGDGIPAGVQIVPKGNGQTRIMYREYLGDVIASSSVGAFSVASYPINPGNLLTFPWLAPIAQQFDQWIPNGIVFEFKSQTTDYSSNQQTGTVIMNTEYDVYDAVYTNKSEMMNAAYVTEGKSTEHMVHGVECDPRQTPNHIYWVRHTSALPAGADLREYDLGTFHIATTGQPVAGQNLGSLWVTYDITLMKEQIYNGIPLRGQMYLRCGREGCANATPLGNAPAVPQDFGNMTVKDVTINPTTITFRRGLAGSYWDISVAWVGTVASAIAFPSVTSPTSTLDVIISNGYPEAGISCTRFRMNFRVKINNNTASPIITFGSAGTLPGGILVAGITIRQITADSETAVVTGLF